MATLAIVLPGVLPRRDGQVALDDKTLAGLSLYAAHWPGDLVVVSIGAEQAQAGPADRWYPSQGLPVSIVTAPTLAAGVGRLSPDLLLSPLIPATTELDPWLDRTVLVAEFTPDDLTTHELREARAAGRPRIRFGGWRRGRRMTRLARAARGIQCNGYAAHDHFSRVRPDALLYFDTRLSADHVRLADNGRERPKERPTLAFSGRLIDAKGPRFAIEAHRLLRDRGVADRLLVLGTGEQEARLRELAGPGVEFLGHVPFDREWTRLMREEVDVMVLPHTQGDPSGTYLEAAGCGVPVAGFDNVTLSALAGRHGLAVTAPLGNVDLLAERIAALLTDHERWRRHRRAGLDFMASHHVEAEYRRRSEHLAACAAPGTAPVWHPPHPEAP